MKQTVVTAYTFTAAAKTLDLGTISGFDIKRLYAVINIDANQIIYAAGIPAYGLASLSGTTLTLVFDTTSMSDTDRLEIIYDTVNTDLANAWVTKLTDGTNSQSYTAAGEAKVSVTQPLPVGTNNIGSITNVTGTVSLPTNAAQESGGHLATLDSKFNTLGQKTSAASAPVVIASDQPSIPVTLTMSSIEIGKVDQGLAGTNAQAWWAQIGDTARGPVAVKAASTAAAAADLSLVVGLSPNSPLPAGTNVLGGVTQSGTWNIGTVTTVTTVSAVTAITNALPTGANTIGAVTQASGPWTQNITQFGSSNVVTGTGASGAGIPRVTVANDSNILATQSGAWTTGRTWTLGSGTDSISAVQSGTWTVQQGTPPWSVVGNVASGASDSGNPVKVGGVFNTSFPTLTNGQRGDIQLDSSARQVIAPLTNTSVVKAQLQDNAGTAIVLGQTTMASSVPVVIASNQTNLPSNITQFGGTNVSTGTGASGAGIPRVTVANDSNILATQSGNWSVRLQDGAGNLIGSTAVSAVNYINAFNPSEGATGSAVPNRTMQVGGSDGTNLRSLSTDTSGNLKVVGSVASASADSGNPVKAGAVYNSTLPTFTTGQRADLQASQFGELAVTQRNKFLNQAGATAGTTIKSGSGRLHTVSNNQNGNAATLTIYDNTTAGGTVIATINVSNNAAATPGSFIYDLEFSTGLTIVTTGAGGNWTLTYQ